MKFRKHISKLLALGILTNNIYFSSSADTAIPNRYETLEGEHITIDDSTEGELVEIEVFGNTVQDENNLEDIQSVGDLYVDDKGDPILDSQGREQYKIDITSTDDSLILSNNEIFNNGIDYQTKGWDATRLEIKSKKIRVVVTNKDGLSRFVKLAIKNDIEDESNLVSIFHVNTPFDKIEIDYELKNSNILSFCTYGDLSIHNNFLDYYDIKIYTYDFKDEILSPVTESKVTIMLPVQLQKVGNVADRLYWDNGGGRYVVEKNIGEFSSEWLLRQSNFESNYHVSLANSFVNNGHRIFLSYMNEDMFKSIDILPVYNELFPPVSNYGEANGKVEGVYTRYSSRIRIWIDSGKLEDLGLDFSQTPSTNTVIDYLKLWLRNNPSMFYYQSSNPEIIETNITSKLRIPTYDGKTHVFIDSENGINPTLKVTVDRLPQIAKNAVVESETNPTSTNISLARMYTNMLSESLHKDRLQEQLNQLFSSDLAIEKKAASVNTDVYIKMKNSLSLSLDTNSIVFDDFDATEGVEMQNAVNLTVSSSLPYRVNAYLEDELYNADKSKKLDKSILNIKSNKDLEYRGFVDIGTPIILLDDQEGGTDTIHGIDIRLNSSDTHKSDVYKTTLKFEVEQK